MGKKRTLSIILQKMLKKAEEENWSREAGRGFIEEQIINI